MNYVQYSGPARPASAAFASLGSQLRFAYWWDAEHGLWLRYVPGMPPFINTLREVRGGQSLVISVDGAATWKP